MKVLELFSGTSSIGKTFKACGHDVYTIDWDSSFCPDLCADIMQVSATDIINVFGKPEIIWASPDCTTYSIAAISKHRFKEQDGNLAPKTDYARYCDAVNMHTHNLILALSPRYWFIENPRGGMRKMNFMHGLPRYTITYCQYGDTRMKPTDIWTNHPKPAFKPMCKNGDSCHERAPRGSKFGTQGRSNAKERSIIPAQLCKHIVDICEK